MANKIIIDNQTDLSDLQAIKIVESIIAYDRISNNGKQYCYGATLNVDDKEYHISSFLNKKSDRFVIL